MTETTQKNGGPMAQLTPERTQRILSDPAFKELASARAKLRWSLSIITLVLFFGFIALISTARDALGANIANSAVPLGLFLALAMIVLVVMLTGFYVQRSNSRFDRLAQLVTREFGQ
jgi:uncharacterized membrane protein (DUF485 family)